MHEAVLQHLNVYHNDGQMDVLYPESAFPDGIYDNIPLVYSETGEHPDFKDVDSNHLPQGFRVVGKVMKSWIAKEGEARVCASLQIDDPEIDRAVSEGQMSLSTGLESNLEQIGDDAKKQKITNAKPNHVILFSNKIARPKDPCAYLCNSVPIHRIETEILDIESKGVSKINENYRSVKLTNSDDLKEPVPESESAEEVVEEVMEVVGDTPAEIAEQLTTMDEESVANTVVAAASVVLSNMTAEDVGQVEEALDVLEGASEASAESAELGNSEDEEEKEDDDEDEEEKEEIKNSYKRRALKNSGVKRFLKNSAPAEGSMISAQSAPEYRTRAEMYGFKFVMR